MKISQFVSGILLTIVALAPLNSYASSLRCGVRLITVGDYKDRVLSECGEPDHVQVWEEERVYSFRHHPRYYGVYDNYEYVNPADRAGSPYRTRKLVIVEEWTYNHGPTRFLDHLRLENGIVRSIASGDYGY
ncbi:hypothetical protein D1BOALGB6SA_2847 [Olavius sp. associated proteobacterium Delta 1]|nr:hypothetical protein D1BOALGB6SA_2847 [Olavius sp. associated proteobacterium Delta 1]